MSRSHVRTDAISAVARRPDPPEAPCRVSQWDLIELAGEGSLTQVYRAQPTGTPPDRPAAYALKTLRPAWQDDPRAVALLRREAFVGRRVSHPHLIAVLAASVHEPPYFVVTPWLSGQTLAELLSGTPPDLPVVLWIVRQVAEALDALYTAGWMHGDVKPSNIFVSRGAHVTLLDLGFARRSQEMDSAADRCVMGTCNYIAPEMITSRLRPDSRSDIYSLGAVLFEALSGQLPFEGNDLAELASQHKEARPPSLRRLTPHLPRGVTRLVDEMLAKTPLRRPQSPAELIERLVALEIKAFSERA
ncbi:MAG: serine/threonine protein kinase [Planctomycetes bacterium]|nr:serine/threonine protein kinase [Planctomycetota bacterium]